MNDGSKTKRQLMAEIGELCRQVDSLEGCKEQILQLKGSHEKFAKAFLQNSIPVVLTTLDEERFVDVSEAFLKMLGTRRDEVIGYTLGDIGFITEAQRTAFFKELNSRGRVENYEMPVRTKGGGLRYGLFNAVMMSLNGEKYLITVITDITERTEVEEALRASETRYRMVVENTNDAIYVHDFEGNIMDVNENACRMSGYNREELIGANLAKIDSEWRSDASDLKGDSNRHSLHMERLLKEGVAVFERTNIRNDGSTVPVEVSVRVASREGKGLVMAFVRDITERKRMEESFLRSQEMYRNLVENINDVIFTIMADGTISYVSPVVEKVLGYVPADLVGTNYVPFIYPDDLEMILQRFRDVLGGQSHQSEYRLFARNGEARWVRTSSHPVFGGEKVIGIQGVLTDITDRKRAEEQLQNSEEKYRLIFQSEPDALFLTEQGENGTIIEANEVALRMYGYSLDEMKRMHIVDFSNEPEKTIRSAVLPIGSVVAIPLRWHRKKDGTVFPVEINGHVFELNGRCVILAVHRDITERKKAETELHESEERFSLAFHLNPAPMIINTIDDGVIRDVNDKWLKLTGYARNEMIGKHAPRSPVWIGKKSRRSLYRKFFKNGFLHEEEILLRSKSGKMLNVLWSAEKVKYKGKEALLSLLYDITERKMLTEALEASERKYRNIFNNVPIGLFRSSPEGRYMEANAYLAQILGYDSSDDLIQSMTDIGSQIYKNPGERDKALGIIHRDGHMENFEAEFICKNGRVIWGSLSVKAVRDEKGNVLYYEGSSKDITERKRMEMELLIHRDKLGEMVAEKTEELEKKTRTLEEMNAALNVLLQKRDEDRRQLEERFVLNVRSLILPYVDKVREGSLDTRQETCMNIIEAHLNEIVTPFLRSLNQYGLTPREVQVATMVKDGRATKEIAKILGIGTGAIDTHRKSIRKKLGLVRTANLHLRLLSLD
jgi:PAS domain S-box-containing protein